MIAEFGLAALWLAAALAALQLIAAVLGQRTGGETLALLVRPAAVAQALLCGLAFLMLLWVFARTDLSVLLVAENSNAQSPLIFKIAGAWGNHEGSMLLWVTIMAAAGGLIALIERRLPERTMSATLGAQAFVALGFYAFLLFASNPFARLFPAPAEGNGLNPLLQDIGLALHPPTLYCGYVGLSIAFSFAVGALLDAQRHARVRPRDAPVDFGRVDIPHARHHRGQLLVLLRARLGRLVVLGPGRERFADAVAGGNRAAPFGERARLARRAAHVDDHARRDRLLDEHDRHLPGALGHPRPVSMLLPSIRRAACSSSRCWRSIIGGALALFAARAGTIRRRRALRGAEPRGRAGDQQRRAFGGARIVLLGTLYPLVTEAFGVRVSVGPPYFNPVSAISCFRCWLVLAVGPLLRWRRDALLGSGRRRCDAAVGVIALLAVWLIAGIALLQLLGLALAAVVAVAAFLPLRGRSLRRLPLPVWGMAIAHFGIAVALFGMSVDSAFTVETLTAADVGETVDVGPWKVRLAAVEPVAGPELDRALGPPWRQLPGRRRSIS